jgi:hypothetical protein
MKLESSEEEEDGGGDVIGLPEAAGGDHGGDGGADFAGDAVEGGGVDRPGADQVDPDAASGELGGPGAGEGSQGSLAGCVDGGAGHALDRAGGPVDDDRPAGGHQRKRLLDGEQGAADVDGEHVVEGADGDRFQWLGQRADARAGVDDVDAAVAGPDCIEEPAEIVRAAGVGLNPGHCAGRYCADGLDGLVE